jgi:hypothetical protein
MNQALRPAAAPLCGAGAGEMDLAGAEGLTAGVGAIAAAAAGESLAGAGTGFAELSEDKVGAASDFSAFSLARMLQMSGGIANSSNSSTWGFMLVGWVGGGGFGPETAVRAD